MASPALALSPTCVPLQAQALAITATSVSVGSSM